MKMKRCASIAMIAVLLLSLTACSHAPQTQPDPTATTTTSVTAAPITVTTVTEPATTVTTIASTSTVTTTTTVVSKPTATHTTATTTTSTQLPTVRPTARPTTPSIVEKITDFGGKTFVYANYGAALEPIDEQLIGDFQGEFNLTLQVDSIPHKEYIETLLSAKAAGKAYTIFEFDNFDVSAIINERLAVPINGRRYNKYFASGGFSYSLMESTAFAGELCFLGGIHQQSPTVIWYNKKVFAAAGYTGESDPLALYNAGKWNWQTLYDMLYAVQQPDKGLYGINAIAPCYTQQFINSYYTDFTKTTATGRFVENLSDPNLFEAYEMLQKYCYGENKVANPRNQNESGQDQFLDGTTFALLSNTKFYKKALKEIPQSRAFDKQLNKLGIVPIPHGTKYTPDRVWEWEGFGAGAGASEQGMLCALMFAKHDSKYNHSNTYTPEMPAEFKRVFCAILDHDVLIAPYSGFNSSAGNLSNLGQTLATAIALNGHPITVALKGYKKVAQTIIDTALKG